MKIDIALIEWPMDGEGGARLLGRLADLDLVDEVRRRLLERRRASVAELERGPAERAALQVVPRDDARE